jgi:hypothetical protein
MFLPLYCVSFGLRLLIIPLSFSCLYVLAIVLFVLRCTASDYPFKLFLSLCSFHCILWPSIYDFWLFLQAFLWLYVLPIVLCILRFTASDYPFKLFFVFMFLPLYCVSFGLRLLIIPSIFSCLYVLTIVLCVLRFTASDYHFKLFLSLCSCHCIVFPSVYGFWLPLQGFLCLYVLVIVLFVLRFTAYDYPFQLFFVFMFLQLYCVFFGLRLLIIRSSFSLSLCSCHCIVCPSVYGFWLPLQSFLVFMFLPLYCVSFGVRLLITLSNFSCLYVLAIVLCVLRCTASDYPFKLFLSLCSYHCIVCPSVYGFWLPLQTFLVFMFFPLYCVSFGLRLLITPSSFTLSLCSSIVLCVLRCTASDYPFKLFLSLCSYHCIVCPSVYASDYPLKLFLSLCSFHCIVCPSLYRFWLHL